MHKINGMNAMQSRHLALLASLFLLLPHLCHYQVLRQQED